MNRSHYYSYVDEKLQVLAHRIEQRGKLNLLELHTHSENFYLFFFNELFQWNLINMNAVQQNVEAIDLIDSSNNQVIQVSATATKTKVDSSLTKDLSKYSSYKFGFISICRDASDLRTKKFLNPHGLSFNPSTDIHDVSSILQTILNFPIERQKKVFDLIKKELGNQDDVHKTESNLAAIINVLGDQDWAPSSKHVDVQPFDVETKLDFNSLNATRTIIQDYSVYYNRIDKIYTEFNKQGKNKSFSIWRAIKSDYVSLCNDLQGDALFLKVIECVTARIQNSSNFISIPYEELELCVNILVVDAFMRCQIFEKPPANK